MEFLKYIDMSGIQKLNAWDDSPGINSTKDLQKLAEL